jgi:diguanylate cyclase (GGDEF)-like protein
MDRLGQAAAAANLRLLREKASRASMQGVFIALVMILLATLAVDYLTDGAISLTGLIQAQETNPVLWLLDLMPFVFGYVGQYSSYVLAREADSLVREQTLELIERTSALEKQADYAATHDTVTGLPNHALFADRVERAIGDARARGGQFGVLVLALDNIKDVQSTLGMGRADWLMKQVAARLSGLVGNQDSLARLESHAFTLLLVDLGGRGEAEKAARILQKAMDPAFALEQMKVRLNVSIGIALYPEHGEDADTLLQRAGVAVFMATRAFSGYAFYAPDFDEHSPRRLTLMGELKQALDKGQFELYHQPKIDLATGRVIGSEALARWPRSRHGFVPPDEFIALAERTRLIRPLTQWVLETAFGDCATLRNAGFEWTVSVNLSTRDLHDPELPDAVAALVARTGVHPGWIIMEITESSIIVDPERVYAVVERLHEMGFNFSIDDYGTGYSSLAYLKRLPVSELKIDKSFVIDMLENENDAIIVRATVELAHNLGLKVTAEGVETEAILAELHGYGCDIGQGYHFSKPKPLLEILDWLKTSAWKASLAARDAPLEPFEGTQDGLRQTSPETAPAATSDDGAAPA